MLLAAVLTTLLAAQPGEAAGLARPATVTAAAASAALALHLLAPRALPPSCRICAPDRADAWARRELLWRHPGRAAVASDVLGVGTPALALALPALVDLDAGGRAALEDALLVAEAGAVATLGTELGKVSTARERPYGWDGSGPGGSAKARMSFPSGHTATAFAAAAAAGTVARLRGHRWWGWLMGGGLALSAATGWLRVAGDRHWATDVVAGAAWGGAVGCLLPAAEASGGFAVAAGPRRVALAVALP
ncbi:MAG: phosphatase PAP2 family protein [Anaeromyxobacter sp.]